MEFIPKITYIQNIACSHDFNKHYWPFIKGLKEMDENIFNHEIDFILYANKEQGHNPLEKAESIAHIQSVLNKNVKMKISRIINAVHTLQCTVF